MAHHVQAAGFPPASSAVVPGIGPTNKTMRDSRQGAAQKVAKLKGDLQRNIGYVKSSVQASNTPIVARSARPHYVASLTPKPNLPPPVLVEERTVLEAVQHQRQKLEERQARLWQQLTERREQHELRENLRQVHLRMKQEELRQQQRELELEIEQRTAQQYQIQQQLQTQQQDKEQPRPQPSAEKVGKSESRASRPSSRRGQAIKEIWERDRQQHQLQLQQSQQQHHLQQQQLHEQMQTREQLRDSHPRQSFQTVVVDQSVGGSRPMTPQQSDTGTAREGHIQRPSTPLCAGGRPAAAQGPMAGILPPSRPRSAPGGRPAYARRATVPRPRPLALRPGSGRLGTSSAVQKAVSAGLPEMYDVENRGVRIPAVWGWTLLPLLLALPQELLAKVGRNAGVTAVVMMSETCKALAGLAQSVSLDLLQEVHGIDWRHTALPRLRQLHVLERMDELLTASMAVFKKPFILAGQGLAAIVSGAATQMVSPLNFLPDPASRITSISCGRNHLVFLDDRGLAWALGDARAGGAYFVDSDVDDGLVLTEPTLVAAMEPKTLIKVACGDGHTVAVSTRGELFRWGRNVTAAPKTSSEDEEEDVEPLWLAPDPSAGLAGEVLDVAAGTSHIVCVSLTGDTYAWGQNDQGQCARALGSVPHDLLKAPALVGGCLGEAVARRVACGRQHTAILTAEGTVYTFGSGVAGQLGRSLGGPMGGGSSLHSWTPLEVAFGDGGPVYIVQVACGDEHTICLTDVGQVFAFGSGDTAQLGLAGLRSQRSAVLVRTLPCVKEVVAGGNWSLFRAKHGKVYAAGTAGEEESSEESQNRWLRQIVSQGLPRPSSSRAR